VLELENHSGAWQKNYALGDEAVEDNFYMGKIKAKQNKTKR